MGEGAHSLPVAGIGAAEFDIDPRPVPLRPGDGPFLSWPEASADSISGIVIKYQV